MKKKTVVLPIHMKDQAKHFGEISGDVSGHPQGSPEYNDAYKKGFYNFCHEAYTHSMTPSGLLGANPTPRISKKNYDSMLDWVRPIARVKGLTKKQEEDMIRQLRTAITIITHQYLMLMTTIKVKRQKVSSKKSIPSSLEYVKRKSFESKYENQLENLEVEKMRFVRLFIASMISAFLEFMFKVSEIKVGAKLKTKFIEPIFDADLGNTSKENAGKKLKLFKSVPFRNDFINAVKEDVFKGISGGKDLMILEKVSKTKAKK
jgi:hypothetical protein